MKVLITSPFASQGTGGIKTYQDDLIKCLINLEFEHQLHTWKTKKCMSLSNEFLSQFDLILHLHFLGGYYLNRHDKRNINIIHGAEISFSSPGFLKRIFKRVLRKSFLNYLEQSDKNIFVSRFSLERLKSKGHREKVS